MRYPSRVERRDPIATGTYFALDARGADREQLRDPAVLDAWLADVAARLEGRDAATPVHHRYDDGSSHAVILDEAFAMLHAFPDEGHLAFLAFHHHAISDADLQRVVAEAFAATRVESSLRSRATAMPSDGAALARRLAGERAWARARLVPSPVPEPD